MSGQSISTDRALELAIDAGAEDVRETEDEEEQPLLQVRREKATCLNKCRGDGCETVLDAANEQHHQVKEGNISSHPVELLSLNIYEIMHYTHAYRALDLTVYFYQFFSFIFLIK